MKTDAGQLAGGMMVKATETYPSAARHAKCIVCYSSGFGGVGSDVTFNSIINVVTDHVVILCTYSLSRTSETLN